MNDCLCLMDFIPVSVILPLEYVTPYITIKNPLGYSLYPRGKITICVFGLL